jgi:hypothetical protein
MIQVLNNLSVFGINESQSHENFLEDFKSKVPFSYDDLVNASAKSKLVGDALCRPNIAGLQFVYYDILINVLAKYQNGELARQTQTEMLRLLSKAVSDKNISLIKLYVSRISRFGAKAQEWLIMTGLPQYFSQKAVSSNELRFAFEMVLAVNDYALQAKFANALIKVNINNADLLPIYLDVYDKNQNLFASLEKSMMADAEYKSFFINKNAYVFKNTPATKQMLLKYFEDYYLKGFDSGIFLFKLKELVAQIKHEELKIKELLSWYASVSKLDNSFGDVVDVVQYIEKEIYANKLSDLVRLDSNGTRVLYEINERLIAINPSMTSRKFEVLVLILLLQGRLGKDKLQDAIANNNVYAGLSAQQLDTFSSEHLHLAISAFVEVKKSNGFNLNNALIALLYQVVNKVHVRSKKEDARNSGSGNSKTNSKKKNTKKANKKR